jgi:hypothetical protein
MLKSYIKLKYYYQKIVILTMLSTGVITLDEAVNCLKELDNFLNFC